MLMMLQTIFSTLFLFQFCSSLVLFKEHLFRSRLKCGYVDDLYWLNAIQFQCRWLVIFSILKMFLSLYFSLVMFASQRGYVKHVLFSHFIWLVYAYIIYSSLILVLKLYAIFFYFVIVDARLFLFGDLIWKKNWSYWMKWLFYNRYLPITDQSDLETAGAN